MNARTSGEIKVEVTVVIDVTERRRVVQAFEPVDEVETTFTVVAVELRAVKPGDDDVEIAVVVDVLKAVPVGPAKIARDLFVLEPGEPRVLNEPPGSIREDRNRADPDPRYELECAQRQIRPPVAGNVHDAQTLIGKLRARVAL